LGNRAETEEEEFVEKEKKKRGCQQCEMSPMPVLIEMEMFPLDLGARAFLMTFVSSISVAWREETPKQ
jgi:hypothetical protein